MALAAVLLYGLRALGSEGYVGEKACAPCHPGQFATQSVSRHAQALRAVAQSPLPELLMARPLRERGGIRFEYELVPEGLAVSAARYQNDDSDVLLEKADAVLEWAFGAGSQGMTAVGRIDGRYFEHRISFFARRNLPAITLGHPIEPRHSARESLGLLQEDRVVSRCFGCHATGLERRGGRTDLSGIQPGIRCERCHGPGEAHVEAARKGDGDPRMQRVENDARKSVEFCGQCHRLPEPVRFVAAPEKEDPLNVRFQPMGLMASLCYQRGKTLSCVTCHNPHEDARTDAGYYVAKCLDCHASAIGRVRDCGRASGENCLPCHMAKIEPTPGLIFTDHRIRVRRD